MNARVILAAFVAIALAGCGGGGGSVTPSAPKNPNTPMQSVSISLVVPSNSGTTAKHREYISASALGAGIVVTQGSTTVGATLDLSASSSACSGSGSSRTCTTTVTVPTGSDVFTVTVYNEAPVNNAIPSGAAILGVGTSTIDVVAGSTTNVPVYIGGEIAHFGATLPVGSLPANGHAQSAVLVIAPTDFGDNPITAGPNDPYANPITVAVTESGGSGYASLSLNGAAGSGSVLVTKSTDSVTLNYSGGGPPGYSFTITLSASGVSSQSSTIAPLIAAVGGTSVTSLGLNGTASSPTLAFGEAGSSRTYTVALAGCANIATIGSVSGSGASATLPVHGGATASASGCALTITDSSSVALVLPVTNTPVGASVTINGTQITEYTGFDAPYGITKGPDGNIWFVDQGSSTVYAINPASGSLVYQYPISEDDLFDITTGSDAALWVTDQTNGGVDRVTTGGVIAQYTPNAGLHPQGIVSAPDGTMWFADNTSGGLWNLTVGGGFTQAPFEPDGTPAEVAYDTNASYNVWFAETNYLGAYDSTSQAVSQSVVPDGDNAQYVAVGSDGNVWVTAYGGTTPFVGFVNPSGSPPFSVTTIALAAGATPLGITAGVDNAMWFVDPGTNAIGEVSLSTHTVTTFPIPTSSSGAREIVTGPDGSLWFTEYNTGKIGHVIP